MSREDQMVSHLIDLTSPSEIDHEDYTDIEFNATPEAHYNHYGDRGAVDLHTRLVGQREDGSERIRDYIFEVKADAAIREATGANEIIRQWNHQRKYFYKDESKRIPDEASFQLVFLPSRLSVQHLVENHEMYEAAQGRDLCEPLDGYDLREQILFRSTKGGHSPVLPFTQTYSIADPEEVIEIFGGAEEHCTRSVIKYLRELTE
ncbi:hypothetical protein EXE51_15790 [Halorubrum sp. CGM5_25_10-8B]|uniref:hypothetical protein n=1 Tax=Halorubrum sp. CGM5_25_10-8B TaxID=2518115 RepID=UPI0010F637B8|nr:hypothetical protein [Halorubrum sp. CGM5_25_10-8B]TKX35135.1 hypothetical protein EXE51_15790 [Halorubrum sp. CGM5_25_10-8B]